MAIAEDVGAARAPGTHAADERAPGGGPQHACGLCSTSLDQAIRLRPAQHRGQQEHFAASDPKVDLLRLPVIGKPLTKMMKSRKFQFLMILPNQLVFWIVIFAGAVGLQLPDTNFATVITWFIWFCIVFVLMVGIGRGWCAMCPFGGAAEWFQRITFWGRKGHTIGLQKHWPAWLAKYGILPSVVTFLILTWFEEFYNIAGPGNPYLTTALVVSIIASAATIFFVFERRTFCRYLCPLTALIGTVGAIGGAAGFRTRDREKCLSCPTKDCMRGSEHGYGCPWYEWPGSATSNLMCGLCTECLKNCPYDNVGMFVQAPLTSAIAPVKRRYDVAWAVALLFGLVIFQQANALPIYTTVDGWLNRLMSFPNYPNPVDYLGIVAVVAAAFAGYVWLLRSALATRHPKAFTPAEAGGLRGFASWFAPISYGMIPLVGADYLSRQLPRLWYHSPRIIAAISDPFGYNWNLFGTAHAKIANAHILGVTGAINSQLVVMALGALAALFVTDKITRRDLNGASDHPLVLRLVTDGVVLAAGIAVSVLYVAMGGAQ